MSPGIHAYKHKNRAQLRLILDHLQNIDCDGGLYLITLKYIL